MTAVNAVRSLHPVAMALLLLAAVLNLKADIVRAGDSGPSESRAAIELLAPPVADGSLAPRFVRIDARRGALTWLERSDAGHRLRYATLENGRFGPPGTVSEGDFFANWADTPGLTVTRDGAWIAHWLERSGAGTYAYDVRLAISRDEGASWDESFTPHRDGTPTEHGFVSYYTDPRGAGLAWLDGRYTLPAPADRSRGHDHDAEDGAMTLRTAVVGPGGALVQEAELDERVCDCCATAAAVTDEGPVVVYRDRSEGEVRDIAIVRKTPGGWSEPRRIHEDGWRTAACPVNGPAVLAREQTVVVAWFTLGAEEQARVHLARSRDGGRSFDAPLTFDRGSALGRVDLAWSGAEFFLSRMARSPTPGEEGAQLRLARFDAQGALLEDRSLVDLPGRRGNGFPRMLVEPGGTVLLAWTEGTAKGPRVRVGRVSLEP